MKAGTIDHTKVRNTLHSELRDFKHRQPDILETEEWEELEEALRSFVDAHTDLRERLVNVVSRDCRRCGMPLQGSREASYEVNEELVSAFQNAETVYRCGNRECLDHGTLEVYQNETKNLVWRFPNSSLQPKLSPVIFSPESAVRNAMQAAYNMICKPGLDGTTLCPPDSEQFRLVEAASFDLGLIQESDLVSEAASFVSAPAGCTCATPTFDTRRKIWVHSDTCPLRPNTRRIGRLLKQHGNWVVGETVGIYLASNDGTQVIVRAVEADVSEESISIPIEDVQEL